MFQAVAVGMAAWSDNEEVYVPPVDLWAAAAQLALGAIALPLTQYSKVATRRQIVSLNRITTDTIQLYTAHPESSSDELIESILTIVCTVVLDLAGNDWHVLDQNHIAALAAPSIYHDGVILIDARKPGESREFALRLVRLVLSHGIGSLGLLQDGEDPVHNRTIDGMSLENLPCVTLYPGVESSILT